jgi:hypothetical protein
MSMTENEAVDILKNLAFLSTNQEHEKCEKAIDMAIQALEEIQQYRAIGTVEQLQFMKSVCDMSDDMLKSLADSVRARMKYEAIGSVEELQALKEKNVAKKAKGIRKHDEAYCPACNEVISDGEFWALDEYVHHCNYCGQAVKGVDWQ